MNSRDTVAREEQGAYPGGQREVSEDLNVIVGEVDRVLWLFPRKITPRAKKGSAGGKDAN